MSYEAAKTGAEGDLILEDGIYPDNPEEREWAEAMRKAEKEAQALYPEDEDDVG